MRRVLPAALLLAGLAAAPAGVLAAQPPPPPPPPACGVCSGPPPPPTLVPTVAPTVVPVQAAVDVKVASTHVARGTALKLAVEASTDDHVTVTLQFHHAKPRTYHYLIGSSGTLQHSWKITKSIPVGPATLKVDVDDPTGSVERVVSLVVTH